MTSPKFWSMGGGPPGPPVAGSATELEDSDSISGSLTDIVHFTNVITYLEVTNKITYKLQINCQKTLQLSELYRHNPSTHKRSPWSSRSMHSTECSHYSGCLQIQPNKFPDFQDTINIVPAGFFTLIEHYNMDTNTCTFSNLRHYEWNCTKSGQMTVSQV